MNLKQLILGKDAWAYGLEINYSFSTHGSKAEIEKVYGELHKIHHFCYLKLNQPTETKTILDDGRAIYSSSFQIDIIPRTYNPLKIWTVVKYIMGVCNDRLKLNQGQVGISFNKRLFVYGPEVPF